MTPARAARNAAILARTAAGEGRVAIAAALGCGTGTVDYVRSRAGVKGPRGRPPGGRRDPMTHPTDRERQARDWYTVLGMRQAGIADALGVSHQRVNQILRAQGIGQAQRRPRTLDGTHPSGHSAPSVPPSACTDGTGPDVCARPVPLYHTGSIRCRTIPRP